MSRGRVLLIDDDRKLVFVLRAHLTNAGFDVDIAHDGTTGFELARGTRPDVILLDIQLPGMDGLEVTRALRQDAATETIPVILVTGRRTPDDIVVGLDAGAQDYIVKPFDMIELTARVRCMYKLSRAQREIDELNQRLVTEVQRKTRRLELLHNFVRQLGGADSVDRIYDLIIQAVRDLTGCRRISIMVPDEHHGKLVCRRAVGISPEVAERICVDTDSGISGQVFTTGTTVVAQAKDALNGPSRGYDSDSFVSTPLVSACLMNGAQRLGVLNATDKPAGESLTDEEIGCVSSIADSAAIALHNEMRRSRLIKSIRALLLTVGRLSEYRDEETGLHLERVRDYAQVLGRQLAQHPRFQEIITPEYLEDLHQAAPLHDLGKVGIPDEILNKPGKLTDEEFQIMKTHTAIGRHTLARALEETGPVPLLLMCMDIAHCHHERFDGRGYPRGLAGEDIPLAARIITLVDAYDAMTSQRVYKKAQPHDKVVENIRQDSGRHFDPDIVAAFLEVADEFDRIRAAKAGAPEPIHATIDG